MDTGPLVALADDGDVRHAECAKAVRGLHGPLLTVWPVLAEVMQFLNDHPVGQEAILGMIESGALELADLGRDDVPRISELIRKYRDQPMDFADAALVRVAEREQITRVLTLDRRDFSVYRAGRWGPFMILP